MCLQWCHVTKQIIHNDHPCLHCPTAIRLAKAEEDCSTCAHFRGQTCALTAMSIPPHRTCCHHNVKVTLLETLELTTDNLHPWHLIFHQVKDLAELFWLVESAPEPKVIRPGVIEVRMEDLAVPFIYGVPSGEWP